MKTTFYSVDPRPFINDGSFVRVVNTENGTEYGIVVNDCVYFQNGGFDSLENVLPDEHSNDNYRINSKDYRIISVWTRAMGFDTLEVPDWEYRKVKPMPKLETGMFVFTKYDNEECFGGLGVVVGNDIVYRGGGHDRVLSFDKNGEGEKHNCKITAVAYGECIKNFNAAKTLINNGTPMEGSKRNLWKAQG